MKKPNVAEAIKRLANDDPEREAHWTNIANKGARNADDIAHFARTTLDPSGAELLDAKAYLSSLTSEDHKYLQQERASYRGRAVSAHCAADRYEDRPSAEAEAARRIAEGYESLALELEEMDLSPLSVIRYADWAQYALLGRDLSRPPQRTPAEQAARAAEQVARDAEFEKWLDRRETRRARNKRHRVKQAVADPKKAEVARLRNNLNKAKGRLTKALARVEKLQAAMRDGTDPTAEVYLPAARLSVATIRTTVDRGQTGLDAAERALAGT